MRRVWRGGVVCLLFFFAACGNDTLFPPESRSVSSIQIVTIESGHVLVPGESVPVEISAADLQKSADMELSVDVLSTQGSKVWETSITAPAINEPLPPLQIPGLTPGQFTLEISLLSKGQQLQQQSTVFFAATDILGITGIQSFPSVITVSAPVLLRVELEPSTEKDPFLVWTWKGTTIARGQVSQGYDEILWTAPSQEGVYPIGLEVFPVQPTMDAGNVQSQIAMTTDIYVSSATAVSPNTLGPASSYGTLFHFAASLKDDGAAEGISHPDASAVGAPRIVPSEDELAYQLANGDGFLIPRCVLPSDSTGLLPFTINIGLTILSAQGEAQLFTLQTTDNSLGFAINVDGATLSPELSVTTPDIAPLLVPSNAHMLANTRHLLSLSFVPRGDKKPLLEWFLDGEQTASTELDAVLPSPKTGGQTMIGGTGLSAIIDEFGVYTRNADGNPSPETDLYSREEALTYKDALVLAEGFDGITPPKDFVLTGPASIEGGFLTMGPGASIELPTISVSEEEGVNATFTPTATSSQPVLVSLTWKDQDQPFFTDTLASDWEGMHFSIKGGAVSYSGLQGTQSATFDQRKGAADLRVVLSNQSAVSSVVMDKLLIVREKD